MGRKIGFIAIGETIEFNGIKAVAVDTGKKLNAKDVFFTTSVWRIAPALCR